MKRRIRKTVTFALPFAALGLLALAASAQAASLNLKCTGKGPQNKAQEYETASCAVAPPAPQKNIATRADNQIEPLNPCITVPPWR